MSIILNQDDWCHVGAVNLVRKDGQIVIVDMSGRRVLDVNGQIDYLEGFIEDITERKRLEEQLQQQATTDELTGVANRRHFLRLAAQELKRLARRHHSLALAIIDLDHFKQINDTYGHAAGDQALVAFAGICRKHLREIDLFARFGGDEFALFLPETNLEQAQTAVERVRQILTAGPLDLAGWPVALTFSAGIACTTDAHEPLDALLARADQALYRAKAAGRNRSAGPDDAGLDVTPLAPDL